MNSKNKHYLFLIIFFMILSGVYSKFSINDNIYMDNSPENEKNDISVKSSSPSSYTYEVTNIYIDDNAPYELGSITWEEALEQGWCNGTFTNSTDVTIVNPLYNFTLINGTKVSEGDLEFLDSTYTVFNSTADGYFKGSYSFTNQNEYETPIGWNIFDGAGGDANITNYHKGHSKVMKLNDTSVLGAIDMRHNFVGGTQTSGTVEFWVLVNDTSQATTMALRDSVDSPGPLIRIDDGVLKRRQIGETWTSTGETILDDTWYHINITFNCVTDTYDLRLNGVLVDNYNFRESVASISYQRFHLGTGAEDLVSYFDAIGFDWYSNYSIGDNVDMVNTELNFTTDINIPLENYESINNLTLDYSFNSSIEQNVNFSVWNNDVNKYDLINDTGLSIFYENKFVLNSSHYDVNNDISFNFNMYNATEDFQVNFDMFKVRYNYTTISSPYYIRDVLVNCSNNPSYGIRIRDTDVPFVIDNVMVKDMQESPGFFAIMIQNCSNSNFTINNSTILNGQEGIQVYSCSSSSLIQNCNFTNLDYDGDSIKITDSNNSIIRNNFFDVHGSGITSINDCVNITVLDNDFNINGTGNSYGIYFTNTDNVVIRNNSVFRSRTSLRLHTCNNIDIYDNYFENATNTAINVYLSEDIIIVNNTLVNNSYFGMDINNFNDTIIQSNDVYCTSWIGGGDGISVDSGNNVTINNNYVIDAKYRGIDCYFSNGTIYNNTMVGCDTGGINYDNEDVYTETYIYDNYIYGNGGTGIAVSGDLQGGKVDIYDCSVENDHYGIVINSLTNGLTRIYNSSFNYQIRNPSPPVEAFGIALVLSENIFITDCNISYNYDYGLVGITTDNVNITENVINTNGDAGIWLGADYGLPDESCDNWIVQYNNITNHVKYGIVLDDSSNNLIDNNYVFNSSLVGVNITGDSEWNNITNNDIFNNTIGIYISVDCDNNFIWMNNFSFNDYTAYDNGAGNDWDNGSIGNYYSDYPGYDLDDDGIGDDPYIILGTSGSVDNYPIWLDDFIPVNISVSIISPTNGSQYLIPFDFVVVFTGTFLNITWYRFQHSSVEFIITDNGTIDSDFWDTLDYGINAVYFYVNDSFGEEDFSELRFIKLRPDTGDDDDDDDESSDEEDEEDQQEGGIPLFGVGGGFAEIGDQVVFIGMSVGVAFLYLMKKRFINIRGN